MSTFNVMFNSGEGCNGNQWTHFLSFVYNSELPKFFLSTYSQLLGVDQKRLSVMGFSISYKPNLGHTAFGGILDTPSEFNQNMYIPPPLIFQYIAAVNRSPHIDWDISRVYQYYGGLGFTTRTCWCG